MNLLRAHTLFGLICLLQTVLLFHNTAEKMFTGAQQTTENAGAVQASSKIWLLDAGDKHNGLENKDASRTDGGQFEEKDETSPDGIKEESVQQKNFSRQPIVFYKSCYSDQFHPELNPPPPKA